MYTKQYLILFCVISYRTPCVPNFCSLWVDHPSGSDLVPGDHEGNCLHVAVCNSFSCSLLAVYSYLSRWVQRSFHSLLSFHILPLSLLWQCWCCLPSFPSAPDTSAGWYRLGWRKSANSPLCWAAVLGGLASSPERWAQGLEICTILRLHCSNFKMYHKEVGESSIICSVAKTC